MKRRDNDTKALGNIPENVSLCYLLKEYVKMNLIQIYHSLSFIRKSSEPVCHGIINDYAC